MSGPDDLLDPRSLRSKLGMPESDLFPDVDPDDPIPDDARIIRYMNLQAFMALLAGRVFIPSVKKLQETDPLESLLPSECIPDFPQQCLRLQKEENADWLDRPCFCAWRTNHPVITPPITAPAIADQNGDVKKDDATKTSQVCTRSLFHEPNVVLKWNALVTFWPKGASLTPGSSTAGDRSNELYGHRRASISPTSLFSPGIPEGQNRRVPRRHTPAKWISIHFMCEQGQSRSFAPVV